MAASTQTQILKRLEDRLKNFTCGAIPEVMREHSEILGTIPIINEKLDRIIKNQEEQFKRLNQTEKDIVRIVAERKTERGMLAFLAALIGALAGWFGRHL